MNYTHTKTGDFINSILTNLNDESGVTWLRSEVLTAICEGIHVIDSLAYFNREIRTFQFPTNTSFIDLPTIIELQDYIGFSKSIIELKSELDRHLLEDSLSTSSVNKEVFNTDEYDNLIKKKVCEFLLESGMIITRDLLPLSSPPISSIQLDENILNVRRLATIADSKYSTITRESEENLKAFYSDSSVESRPYPEYFSLSASPKNLIRFYPNINVNSQLELLSIKQPEIANDILPIPTNVAWAIKYGILYEYYRQQGNGYDEQRAKYCKSRWQQGISIARNYFLILDMRIADKFVGFATLDDFDNFSPEWQNTATTNIQFVGYIDVAFASWNMIALSSKVDSSLFITAEIDFLRNSILPQTEDDYIQIPFEFMQILDAYAQHYLQLKIGGERLFSGIEKLNSTFEALVRENARLNISSNELALIPYKTIKKEYIQHPIEAEGYELATQEQNANG